MNAPLITGKTPSHERDKLYAQFREGRIRVLIVSKVANFAIDLPDANVAIQLSGQFGSRQEEAQRLGRILRPKSNGTQAYFYSIVTKDTKDQEFAMNRQRFLTEQGYQYNIRDADELPSGEESGEEAQLPADKAAANTVHDTNVYPIHPSSNIISMSAFKKAKRGE